MTTFFFLLNGLMLTVLALQTIPITGTEIKTSHFGFIFCM